MNSCSSAEGGDERDPATRQALGIEGRLHRETSAEQADAPQAPAAGHPTGCVDDADQRNSRPLAERLEDDMGRVGSKRSEVRAGTGQAVDEDRRIVAVSRALPAGNTRSSTRGRSRR